jgi:hypothetical protein
MFTEGLQQGRPMSLGLPAIFRRWFKHWSSCGGDKASVRRRERTRLAMGVDAFQAISQATISSQDRVDGARVQIAAGQEPQL